MTSVIRANIWQNSSGVPYGTVLQVRQTVLTGTFSTASTSWINWTGMAVTITPQFSTSRIFLTFTSQASNDTTNSFQYVKVQRNGADIALGDTAGPATRCWIDGAQQTAGTTSVYGKPLAGTFLDSPATTSPVTYQIQVIRTANGTAFFGRTADIADGNRSSIPSVLTAMEIAG
jgi:hypothetical protein